MKKGPLIVFYNDSISSFDHPTSLVGGKAYGLHKLFFAKANVPLWFTITTEAYETSNQGLSSEARLLIKDAWLKLQNGSSRPVAVRSSAIDEDTEDLSFAGQMESFLNIVEEKDLYDAVEKCWASAFTKRAVAYRREHGLDQLGIKVAVVVQLMVDASVSGVIFTADPVKGDKNNLVISALWGLGEGLVSRGLNADNYTVSRDGKILSKDISSKSMKIISKPGGGVLDKTLSGEESKKESLSERDLLRLSKIGKKLEREFGFPLDIEFCFDGKDFYILQARPITTLKSKLGRIVWDNSNIIESYSGVTTPLTFSFISRAYSIVYWQFCEALGMSKAVIKANEPTFRNMLGLIQGRVFYNLISWYRLVSLLPGFSWNKKFMEGMMGVKESLNLQSEELDLKNKRGRILDFFHMLLVGLRMFFNQLRLEGLILDFHSNFNKIYKDCQDFNIPKRKPAELLKLYQKLERDLLWEWKAPIINDFSAMIFYGILKNLVVFWGLDSTGSLQNDLLCGEEGVLSTEPMQAIMRLAQYVQAAPKLKEVFNTRTPEAILDLIYKKAEYSDFSQRINAYINAFGDRCINELKLESSTLKENPVFLIAMIKNYVASGASDPNRQKDREKEIRRKAEEIAKKELGFKLSRLLVPKRVFFFWILRHTRRAVKNRENQRFARTKVYGVAREIFRTLGEYFAKEKLLNSSSDIFYLNYDEVWAFIEGRSTLTNLKALVDLRRAEFKKYQEMPPPDDRFETSGTVYHNNQFTNTSRDSTPIEGEKNIIRGLGCCQGKIEGEVKVVLSPSQDIQLKGEILVASQTDPGWVLLFPSISGLIIERGSMLSHTAIVAREMGIPTIVGAIDATKRLKNGDKVVLDGAAGIVRIL